MNNNLKVYVSVSNKESKIKHFKDIVNNVEVFTFFNLVLNYAIIKINKDYKLIVEDKQFNNKSTIKEVEKWFNDIIDNFYFNEN